MTNFYSDRASVVNNSIYATKSQWGLHAGLIIKQKHELYVLFQQSAKHEQFLNEDFTFNTLVGGIKFRL